MAFAGCSGSDDTADDGDTTDTVGSCGDHSLFAGTGDATAACEALCGVFDVEAGAAGATSRVPRHERRRCGVAGRPRRPDQRRGLEANDGKLAEVACTGDHAIDGTCTSAGAFNMDGGWCDTSGSTLQTTAPSR